MKRNTKNLTVILLILIILSLIGLTGCSTQVNAEPSNKDMYIGEPDYSAGVYTYIIVDSNTGINYIVTKSTLSGNGGISIVPRYNPDGTLYVTQKDSK